MSTENYIAELALKIDETQLHLNGIIGRKNYLEFMFPITWDKPTARKEIIMLKEQISEVDEFIKKWVEQLEEYKK
jgi:hypothetical protein